MIPRNEFWNGVQLTEDGELDEPSHSGLSERNGRVEQVKTCVLLVLMAMRSQPVPIPNTEVKLISVENTWLETAWEDRAVPAQNGSCQ